MVDIDKQMEYDRRYRAKNRELTNYKTAKRSARSFINTKADPQDLLELRNLIDEKLEEARNLMNLDN